VRGRFRAGPVASYPDVLRSFRRRSPADSAAGSSAPPGSRSAPPAEKSVHECNALIIQSEGCVHDIQMRAVVG